MLGRVGSGRVGWCHVSVLIRFFDSARSVSNLVVLGMPNMGLSIKHGSALICLGPV